MRARVEKVDILGWTKSMAYLKSQDITAFRSLGFMTTAYFVYLPFRYPIRNPNVFSNGLSQDYACELLTVLPFFYDRYYIGGVPH